MSWVTIVWSMAASACLTLAAINLLVWLRNRTVWANLLFSLAAVAAAAFAYCELWVIRSDTIGEFGAGMRWAQVPLLLWVVSLVGFVRLYLGQVSRPWLAWAACGLRAFVLLPDFLAGQNLNYREITALRQIPFLGESVPVAEGVPNPWMLVGQLSALLLIIYIADASVAAWRSGDRRKAVMVGGSIVFFLTASVGESVLVFWGKFRVPIMFSLFYLGIVAAMGYELSRDVLRASQLARELRTSEAGLRESEERMSLAVDAADLGMWILDLARNDIWASERWRKLFGFPPRERLELYRILQRLHPEDQEAFRQALGMAVTSGAVAVENRYELEFRLMLPDGGTRWIASQGRIEFDPRGQPVLIRGTFGDCTSRRQADQEMLLLRQEIAHVGRVSMMGQFASALAHEINQPLGAILRNAEAAEIFMQNASPDLDEIRAILADIRTDDQRAGTVIDRMRMLLKRHALDTQPLDMGELMRDVAVLVRPDAAARQVKLDVSVPGDLPPVRGDRVQLQQVLLNLILNGMDALVVAGQGGEEDRRVRVTARITPVESGDGTVEIAVSDTGHGISADTLARIFDPFFTTKPDGMGVGLSISRTIIEAHGGRLWAENNAENSSGCGAAFRFTLPVAEKAALGWA
jgi:two-component system sensor kinase FixL